MPDSGPLTSGSLGPPSASSSRDLFPLVIDVAVWVGSMNALEARERGRRAIDRYA